MSFTVMLDTEFTTLDPHVGYPALISIGCVAEDYREFYAELKDTWQPGNCSDYVLKNVLPLLQGGECHIFEAQCAVRLKDWIEGLTDQEVILRSDNPMADWPWIEQLFQFFGCWPKNLRRKCGMIYFEEEHQQQRYQECLEDYWKDFASERHHALVDARSLMHAWRMTTDNTQGFIQDEYAAQKDKNRRQFGDLVKRGLAKATDASAFHGLGKKIKVTYRNEDFDVPEMKPQLLDKEK